MTPVGGHRHLLTVDCGALDKLGELPPPRENSGSSDSSWTHFPLAYLGGKDGGGLHALPNTWLWRGSWGPGPCVKVGISGITSRGSHVASAHTGWVRGDSHTVKRVPGLVHLSP